MNLQNIKDTTATIALGRAVLANEAAPVVLCWYRIRGIVRKRNNFPKKPFKLMTLKSHRDMTKNEKKRRWKLFFYAEQSYILPQSEYIGGMLEMPTELHEWEKWEILGFFKYYKSGCLIYIVLGVFRVKKNNFWESTKMSTMTENVTSNINPSNIPTPLCIFSKLSRNKYL